MSWSANDESFLMSRKLPILFALLAAGTASGVAAQEQVYTLSPAEAQRVKDTAALRTDTDTPALLPDPARDRILSASLYDKPGSEKSGADKTKRKIHGEVSMFAGTGGTRGIAATTIVPIGETGYASFSFSTGRYPGYGGYGVGYGDGYGFGRPFGYGHPGW